VSASAWVSGPLAAGLAVAAYAASLRRYGIFDLADEGVLLAQAWRVAQGEVPYVDFSTGYGPLYFRLQGALVGAGGIEAVRWALVAVHAASAGVLHALTRRLAGPALAAVAVAVQVAFFLAVAPRQGAPFNLPYPAWYAGLLVAGTALLLAGRPPRASRLVVAGALAGTAFAMKPNSGLLLAAGVAVWAVLDGPRGAHAGPFGAAVLGLAVVGAAALVAPTGVSLAAVVLVAPVMALAVLGARRGAPDGEVGRRLLALGAGFGAVAAVFLGPYLVALGAWRFAREVLLLGAGVAQVYALPFPWPALAGTLVGVAAFGPAGRRPRPLVLAGLAALALGLVVGAGEGGSLRGAVRTGAETAAFVCVPLGLWGVLAALRRRHERELLAPAAVGVLAALQLYPRPDFVHLMPLGPVLLPLMLQAWRSAARRLPLSPGALGLVCVGMPLLVAGGRSLPTAAVLGHAVSGRLARVTLGGAELVVEPAGAGTLRAIAAAAEALRTGTGPEERVLTFPACGVVPFFARRLPAGPHDYFYPGRPDRAEAAALAAWLAEARPRLAVTCAADGTEVAAAWDYYPEMVALIGTRYAVRLEQPPFRVHALRE
jgi:hypothetical protein